MSYARVQQVGGMIFIVLVVGIIGYALFGILYWDPTHRPVVFLGGAKGAPWSISVDGAMICPAVAPVGMAVDDSHLVPCETKLTPGVHTLSARSPDGAEVFRTEATIARGDSSYLWAPEIPKGLCIRTRVVRYAAQPSVLAIGSSDPVADVPVGFHDLGVIDVWFKEPPGRVQSKEKGSERRTVRLEKCEAPPP